MSRMCQITGKTGQNGHKVSHANNKTNHIRQPNLRKKRIFVPELNRTVTVRLTSHGLRILNKRGAYRTLKEAGLIR